MVKGNETARGALIPETTTTAEIKYSQRSGVGRFDAEGNYECVSCGFTHTVRECAEYRLVHANKELEKVIKFVHMSIGTGHEGESPVDTFIRGYQRLYASWRKIREARGESTEITEMMKEE